MKVIFEGIIFFVSDIFDEDDFPPDFLKENGIDYVVDVGRFPIETDEGDACYFTFAVNKDGTVKLDETGCLIYIDGFGDFQIIAHEEMEMIKKSMYKTYGEKRIVDTIMNAIKESRRLNENQID